MAAVASPHRTATAAPTQLFNAWQRALPLVSRPFDAMGAAFDLDGRQVRDALRMGLERGEISRIGGVFGIGSGGSGMLCALQVPEHERDAVAAHINAEPGVNHNYAREHRLNLWFVVTASDDAQLHACVDRLDRSTGFVALRLPMLRAYRIDLGFDLFGAQNGPAPLAANDAPPVSIGLRPLAARLEDGLPLVERPYAELGAPLGMDEHAVIATLRDWCDRGTLRRLGVVLRHHEFGISANAMTVFALPAHAADAAGARLAQQTGVTLCYRREAGPQWPYTLYCMVHGRERAEVLALIEQATCNAGLAHCPREILFSTQRYKQTGGRYFAGVAA
jgi:DNA-binding Lrp family transcriptional regulator